MTLPKILYLLAAIGVLATVFAVDNKAGLYLAALTLIVLLINRSNNFVLYSGK